MSELHTHILLWIMIFTTWIRFYIWHTQLKSKIEANECMIAMEISHLKRMILEVDNNFKLYIAEISKKDGRRKN